VMPGIAAIVLPDPIPPAAPSAVEQATTHEELIRALPELFAAEPEPPRPVPPPLSEADADQGKDDTGHTPGSENDPQTGSEDKPDETGT